MVKFSAAEDRSDYPPNRVFFDLPRQIKPSTSSARFVLEDRRRLCSQAAQSEELKTLAFH